MLLSPIEFVIKRKHMDKSNTLVLIDGSSFLFRAYFAPHGKFTTKSGIPTGATLIMTRMLKKLMGQYDGIPMVVVFDTKGKSFRAEIYPEYKANRPTMPDDLRIQIEYVHRIVEALSLPLVMVPGVEADDVLGTYARLASARGMKTIICTGDKDMAQLVDDNVSLYDSMSDKHYDAQGVKEKFGVPPSLIIDFLALKGDSSDNIPGMKGVGDVKACTLLNSLGGIDEIMEKKDQIKDLGFRGSKTFAEEYVREFDTVKLSYKLATIKTDVELPLGIDDIKVRPPDYQKLLGIYKELEFRQLYAEDARHLQDPVPPADDPPPEAVSVPVDELDAAPAPEVSEAVPGEIQDFRSYGARLVCIQDEAELERVCADIRKKGFVTFDTETTSLRAQDAQLVGISVCTEAKEAYYIPVGHTYLGVGPQLPVDTVKKHLGAVMADGSIRKIGQNIKYDLLIMHFAGFEVKNVYFDTMVAAHVCNNRQPAGMDPLAEKYLNYRTIKFSDVVGTGSKAILFNEVPLETATEYAAEDALVTYRLYLALKKELEGIEGAQEIFYKQEMPLVEVLTAMEQRGILLSAEELGRQGRVLKEELAQVENEIYRISGSNFNIASPKQLGKILFEDLGIKYPKPLKPDRNGVLNYSTAEDVLSAVEGEHELVPKVLRYRTLSKLINTYTDKLAALISPRTGRLHTSYNQAGTITGRLSSTDPNLQNIPARGNEGRLIRHAFVPAPGYKMVSIDYSQIELRLIAHMSGDPNLIQAFLDGQDIHRATAAQILGKDPSEVTDDERSHAKATNFGLMYGMGPFKLSQQTGMPFYQAKEYIDQYFKLYPSIHSYMDRVVDFAVRHGYVTTLMNHRLRFDEGVFDNPRTAPGAKREAINAPMQGSAAEIIKIAMIRIFEYLRTLDDSQACYMLLQIHDELIFEIKEGRVDEISDRLVQIMEGVVELKVPLKVSKKASDYWDKA